MRFSDEYDPDQYPDDRDFPPRKRQHWWWNGDPQTEPDHADGPEGVEPDVGF